MHARTRDGRAFRLLTVIDEFGGECPAIVAVRTLRSDDMHRLAGLSASRWVPGPIRSDHGPESAAKAVLEWPGRLGVDTSFLETGSLQEAGRIESSSLNLRDGLLDPPLPRWLNY